jgi:hypothetical protein
MPRIEIPQALSTSLTTKCQRIYAEILMDMQKGRTATSKGASQKHAPFKVAVSY